MPRDYFLCSKGFQVPNWIAVLFVLGLAMNAHCQIDIVENTRLVLPTVDNYRTVIDKKEITWICSENGLTRFNFDRSKRFQIADGLPTNDIWQLYNDNFDRTWLFHKENGIYFIRNDSVHIVKGSEQLRETFVVADLNDTIFFKTFGFFNQDTIGDTYYYTKDGRFGKRKLNHKEQFTLSGRKLSSIVLKAGDRTYLDEQGNNYRDYHSFSYGNIITDDSIQFLFVNKGSKNDIYFLSSESKEIQNIKTLVGAPVGRSIFIPNSLECILEVNDSIRFYSNIALNQRDIGIERILTPFYNAYGIDFNFSKDSEGNIWITVHRGGVHFIPKSYCSIFPLDQLGPTASQIMERNFVYLGTIKDRLYVFSRNSLIQEINLTTGEKKVLGSSKDLKDVKLKGEHIAWSNNDGITIQNAITGVTTKMTTGQRVVSFDFINETTIYTNTGHEYDLLTGKIRSQNIVMGPVDHLAISDSAIFTYKNNHVLIRKRQTLETVYSVPLDNVINIERISARHVGFFIENNGIIVFDYLGNKIGHAFKGASIQKAFFYKNYFFAISDQDILYTTIDSKRGIDKKVHRYQTFLGRINLSIQSATVYKNTLILGLNNGIYNYQIADILGKASPPPRLFFIGVSTNNVLQVKQQSEFSYSDKDFSFAFNAYSYGNFGDVSLHYQLAGFDDKWYSSKSHTILYKSLPPGDYTLSVFASANGNNSERINYSFSIPTPFWQSTPFIIICTVLFIIGLIKVFQIIFRYRTKIYERKNMLLELEFKALKAQLNPHFIFNSLNSLQTVMHRKSEIEANEYIVSFSRLMRTLLDNSRVLSISLADELEFLKNFVFLSAQKINDPISFVVDMGNIVEPEHIHIRNMILQPFIENAVLHGLANKVGEKWIRLELEKSNQTLIVTITDNGVGRKAADKYNKRKADKHNSVSTTILKEKSRLLKEMNLEELNFATTDLYENGIATGTKVVVRMRIFDPSN